METGNVKRMDLPTGDFAEKAAERRRVAEAARKPRIFNARRRVIGLDVDGLNRQVEQKKVQQSTDKQRDRAFDDLREYQDEVNLQNDIDDQQKRASVSASLAQFWGTQQRFQDSRDADLMYEQRRAPNLTLPKDQLGPSCMQIFEGEDGAIEDRMREQMRTTERDLRAQMDDNERKLMREKHREMLMSRELVNQDMMWTEQAELEEECRRAARMALDNYNQALATDQAANVREQRRREERDNLAEKRHILTSDLMTECVDSAADGATPRVLADRWKGLSAEQLRDIYREREEQRLGKERRRQAEKLKEAEWDCQLLNLSRKAEEQANRVAELRRDKRIQMDQYNMRLAREQQAQQDYLNKKVYTNKPTDDYYQQFNTTTR